MLSYLIRRVGLGVVIVFTALLTVFVLLHLMPGDPVSIALGPRATPEIQAQYAQKMRLDEPLVVQFAVFASGVVSGDLGHDVFSDRPVATIVFEQLPYTIILSLSAIIWATLIGIPLGCLSAIKPNSWLDRVLGVISVGTIAIPAFLVSVWSLLLFSLTLRWFPVIGAGDIGDPMDQLYHLILPAFAVGLGWVGYLARLARASMLEVMNENHVRAARAFGLRTNTVVYRYALRMAILPTITMIGIGFGNLLSGTVFAEIIFARPGIGKLIYDMVIARNFPVVQGAILVTAAMYVIATLVSDLMVAWLDPRVREAL